MGIVGGLDIHQRQITFDYLDEHSGESRHGRIAPADRMLLRSWLEHLLADTGTSAAFTVEGCTGWRFVVEELQRAGIEAHLAEPADTAAVRGPKHSVVVGSTPVLSASEARTLLDSISGRDMVSVRDRALIEARAKGLLTEERPVTRARRARPRQP